MHLDGQITKKIRKSFTGCSPKANDYAWLPRGDLAPQVLRVTG